MLTYLIVISFDIVSLTSGSNIGTTFSTKTIKFDSRYPDALRLAFEELLKDSQVEYESDAVLKIISHSITLIPEI